MTSVNTQQYAPYHANYEMPPKPSSDRNEGNAEVQESPSSHSPSASPRHSMSPQQRGQFSAHRGIVNSTAAATQADPAALAQLSKENQELRAKLEQMRTEFSPQIIKLSQQLNNLQEQFGKSAAPVQEGSPSTPDASSGSGSSAPSEVAARSENPPVSEQQTPQSFQQLTLENKQLKEAVVRMQTQFEAIVTKFQEQIQALAERLHEGGAPSNQVAPQGSDARGTTPSDPSAVDDTPDTNNAAPSTQAANDTPSENPGVNDYLRENQQLRARIEQMSVQYGKVLEHLQRQVEELTNLLKAKAAKS
ncbi:hypothetical protein [Pseudomonas rhodesiae]|uniref:hypothetical protein n=1 Tax=Pseudomonas rhodesiae TaxID=76760 RepID=UPI00241E6D01|nr:hypothetical protein [Pseudomonas rhodesiae]